MAKLEKFLDKTRVVTRNQLFNINLTRMLILGGDGEKVFLIKISQNVIVITDSMTI